MKHLVVVGALLLSTVGSFAGEVTGTCEGVINKGFIYKSLHYYSVGDLDDCGFDGNSLVGKRILKLCPENTYCTIKGSGPARQGGFWIKKIIFMHQGSEEDD